MKHPRSSSSNIFDAVSALEAQDATTQHHRASYRDVARSRAAQAQTQIYRSAVECRILWQRAPSAPLSTAALEPINALLIQLLRARRTLSGSEDEVDYAELVQGDAEEQLSGQLQLEYEQHRSVWKEVLDRRHREVRLHAGAAQQKQQFRILDASFWQQIEATVQHERIRQPAAPGEFDDTKVYQQLLKDFVTNTTNSTNVASVGLARSNKTKANKAPVDRKASKGRKLRYTELSKLRNFTFPISRTNVELLDEDAWFRSLLGGATNRVPSNKP
jgi:Apoptosis-antagonizing transcription factor, C-terminal